MAYGADLTWDEAVRIAQIASRTVIRELQAAEEAYQLLLDAQAGQTVLAWTRALYEKPDTENATLTVVAATGVISCITGAGLFTGFQPGRDVQITNFTNAGNNQTTEILAATTDSITIATTGLVNETDTNARCQQNPSTDEQATVTALVAAMLAHHELYGAMTNVATTTADRADLLRDFAG